MNEKCIVFVGGPASEISLHLIAAHVHTNGYVTGV